MARFKDKRTGAFLRVKNEENIRVMRGSDWYEEVDDNGNPVNPKPYVDPHEGAVQFRDKHTGNTLWAKTPDNIRLMRESDQYEEITSE